MLSSYRTPLRPPLCNIGQAEKGPLALAQTEERGTPTKSNPSFESEMDSRMTTIEARLLELELEVDHLLQLQEGG